MKFNKDILQAVSENTEYNEDSKSIIFRLSTSCYMSNGSLVSQRTIRPLKRKSSGISLDCFYEDISNIGALDVWNSIGIEKLDDGIYEMTSQWSQDYFGDWDFDGYTVSEYIENEK